MAAPVVKKKGVVVSGGSACPICGHTVNTHVEEKARHCNVCACVAQDVH